MGRLRIQFVTGLVTLGATWSACAAGPSRPPGDSEGPLDCSAASPCVPLQQELDTQCNGGLTTVRRGMLEGLTVVTVETDPESYVYTRFTSYYDAAGRLVGRSSFISEYARHVREGQVPVGSPVGWVDVCVATVRPPTTAPPTEE
jgi:hypothetical protein